MPRTIAVAGWRYRPADYSRRYTVLPEGDTLRAVSNTGRGFERRTSDCAGLATPPADSCRGILTAACSPALPSS
jgi:hypothetical protein